MMKFMQISNVSITFINIFVWSAENECIIHYIMIDMIIYLQIMNISNTI